ncbi:MAG TPA: crosslink repair DNA glycosylase YcaQ family protein [Actinomycetes bacterium]|nr:crosslink repair DNA glycosylase YcaQ family protein [Actinomycetes bacterium]
MPDTLTIDQARRLALAAQGFTRAARRGWSAPAPPSGGGGPSANGEGPATAGPPAAAASLRALLRRVGAIQIDSINVVARSHELVLAARAGAHDPVAFQRLVYQRRAGFEYWGHAASFLPIENFRLFLPRMARMAAQTRGWWADTRSRHRRLYDLVLERIRAEGPLAASDFREPGGRRRGTWWDWAPAKHVLEDLFDQGVLLVHDRVRFERRYDLAERVLPGGLDLTEPTTQEAAVELTVLAARALGVATAADLADYFRLRPNEAKPALAEAAGSGLLSEVRVRGWSKPAYLLPGTPLPRRAVHPPTLLSPFDSLIWSRQRTERLFGFHYRIEVYVPAAQRQHGYYTMPVLAGGRPIARVDPKHDRQTGALLLRNLTLERGVDPEEGATATAAAARRLAAHLHAERFEVGQGVPRRLAATLHRALAAVDLGEHAVVAAERAAASGMGLPRHEDHGDERQQVSLRGES